MTAQASSLEPCFVLAWLLVGFVCLALWYHRRGRIRLAREPEDRTALLADTFIIKPYVQLGNYPRLSQSEQFELSWHIKSAPTHKWQVQARVFGESTWRPALPAVTSRVTITALGEHIRCYALMTGFPAGAEVEYRVLCDGNIAFASSVRTRNSADQVFRIAIAGDIGDASQPHERKIAYQMHKRTPNLLVIPGDIVYDRGRVSEYMRHFFPVLNSDTASAQDGAPLLRSVLTMACVGNHDVGMPHADHRRNFTQFPDLLGYFLFHSQPLNGPDTGGGANMPFIEGDEAARNVFLKAAGERFPRMANFSFEWGNSHWLVLDANAYMDWTNRALRSWVANELKAAQKARWRFVMFHQPAFTSDRKHSNEQRMRLLTPIFEEHGVDVVFVGHVHCYERTRPLRFTPHRLETKLHTEECPVEGDFAIDTKYDGDAERRPNGIIYVTSGAAGAKIHKGSDPGPNGLKPYTAFYSQVKHSFTLCDVTHDRLLLRQVNEDGDEIDRFIIEK